MRVLVACEKSGRVRNEFAKRGHDAWSCDLEPTETPGQHFQGDVRLILRDIWDLIIAHPECTFLTVSNNGPITHGCRFYTAQQAKEFRDQAIEFFMLFTRSKAKKTVIENPIGIMSKIYRSPDQIIQPWQFGDDASKRTCLWLKGVPPLVPTNILPGGAKAIRANQTISGQNSLGPSRDRKRLRSMTYPGIAAAMATQWGGSC